MMTSRLKTYALSLLLILQSAQPVWAQVPSMPASPPDAAPRVFPPNERVAVRWVFPEYSGFIRLIVLPTPMGEAFHSVAPENQRRLIGWTWSPRFRFESCQWSSAFSNACRTISGPMRDDGYANLMTSLGLSRYPSLQMARQLCQNHRTWMSRWLAGEERISPYAAANPILQCRPLFGLDHRTGGSTISQPTNGISSTRLLELTNLAVSSSAADGLRLAGANITSFGMRIAIASIVLGVVSRVIGPIALTGPSTRLPVTPEITTTVRTLQILRNWLARIQRRTTVSETVQSNPAAIAAENASTASTPSTATESISHPTLRRLGQTSLQVAPSLIYSLTLDHDVMNLLQQQTRRLNAGEQGMAAQSRLQHQDIIQRLFQTHFFESTPAFYQQMDRAWNSIQNIEVPATTSPREVASAFEYLLGQLQPSLGTLSVHHARTSQQWAGLTSAVQNEPPLQLLVAVGGLLQTGVSHIQNAAQRLRTRWDSRFGTILNETIRMPERNGVRAHECEITYNATTLWNTGQQAEPSWNAIRLIRQNGCEQLSEEFTEVARWVRARRRG